MTVHLKPSKQLIMLLVAAHCAILPLVWLLNIHAVVKLGIGCLLLFSLYYYLNQDALLRFASSIVSLELAGSKYCVVRMREGNSLDCVILGISFVSASLTVLILQPAQQWSSRSVVIFPDSIDADEFRRLRILLRWK